MTNTTEVKETNLNAKEVNTMITKTEEFNGLAIFKIFEKEGDKYPIISGGVDKIEKQRDAILNNLDKINDYLVKSTPAYREAQAKRKLAVEAKKIEKQAKKDAKDALKAAREKATVDAYLLREGLTLSK
jgi:hypothetical protein